MAETIWQGGVSGAEGNIANANNWSDGLPGVAKAALAISGTQNMDAGLTTSTTWLGFFIGPGYSGQIASESANLITKFGADGLVYGGVANAYIDFSGAANPGFVKIESPSANTALWYKCGTGAADLDELLIRRGTAVNVSGNVVKVRMNSVSVSATDAAFMLLTGTIALIEKAGGVLTQTGGILTLLEQTLGSSTITDGQLGTLRSHGGSTIYNTAHGSSTPTIDMFGGSFDASGDGRAKTLAHVEMHGEAAVNLNNLQDNITITDGGVYVYGQNQPIWPGGTQQDAT